MLPFFCLIVRKEKKTDDVSEKQNIRMTYKYYRRVVYKEATNEISRKNFIDHSLEVILLVTIIVVKTKWHEINVENEKETINFLHD